MSCSQYFEVHYDLFGLENSMHSWTLIYVQLEYYVLCSSPWIFDLIWTFDDFYCKFFSWNCACKFLQKSSVFFIIKIRFLLQSAGFFGEVFHGIWNGIQVAVKVFLEQDLTLENIEDFCTEISILRYFTV